MPYQFLSPYSNKRTDEYGRNFENRMRFPLGVIRRVRDEVGENFPIVYRMSAEEYVAGGLTIRIPR
jgi:2,4-dienoyl-CoA reductase-like NADH-dependent reductase (Old Yellow Enzyme family)